MLKDNDFIRGISFEPDPFSDEEPDSICCFDLDGNEVREDAE